MKQYRKVTCVRGCVEMVPGGGARGQQQQGPAERAAGAERQAGRLAVHCNNETHTLHKHINHCINIQVLYLASKRQVTVKQRVR